MTTENTTTTAPENQQPALQQQPLPAEARTVADAVLAKISQFEATGTLRIPKDYSAENSLRAAWLMLQEVETSDRRKALEVCTRESIANALFGMVVQGLNPVKKQCYFIPRGNKLLLQRSYMGTIAIAKRDAHIKEANANVIYKGDVFEYAIDPKTGRRHVLKHEQKLENIDLSGIIGAYVTVVPNEGEPFSEIMTMAQIKSSWAQGGTGNTPAHQKFPDQMAMKTVTNRGLKIAIGASSDNALFEDEEETPIPDAVTAHVKHEIASQGNQGPELSIEEVPAASTASASGAPREEVKEVSNDEPAYPF